jgi:hypothetical protein
MTLQVEDRSSPLSAPSAVGEVPEKESVSCETTLDESPVTN